MEQVELRDRLRFSCKKAGHNLKSLAAAAGFSRGALSRKVNGRQVISWPEACILVDLLISSGGMESAEAEDWLKLVERHNARLAPYFIEGKQTG
jgi:transcriptional regulator with XRE-family HTH domain